jgi:molybdopterin converting factor small subunit
MIEVLYFAWVRERIGLPRERWKQGPLLSPI